MLHHGIVSKFIINLLLTFSGWLPAIIHVFMQVKDRKKYNLSIGYTFSN
nr:YqaE/Pmp3 family membrane protein [Lacinutrix mariniflava]